MSEQTNSPSFNKFDKKLATLEDAVEKVKDKRFEDYNSRLNEQHHFFRHMLQFAGILFILVQIIVGYYQFSTVAQQKDDIRRMETTLKEDIASQLGKSKSLPEIEVYAPDGGTLTNNSVVDGVVEIWTSTKEQRKNIQFPLLLDANGNYKMLRINFVIKNTGKARSTEKVLVFMYTNDPIRPITADLYGKKFTGEDGFNYVTWSEFTNYFPPNIAIPAEHTIRLPNNFDTEINAKLYPVILKLSYGDESLTTVKFNLRILPKVKVIPFAANED